LTTISVENGALSKNELQNSLGKDLRIDVSGLSEEKIQDIEERIKLGDVEGLSAYSKTSRNHALQTMKAFHEKSSSGQTVRKMLRTPDSRRLAKEILTIFASEASSAVARDGILLLDQKQMLPRDLLRERLDSWKLGKSVLEEAEALGRLDRLKSILAGIQLASSGSPLTDASSSKKTSRSTSDPSTYSDTINYFVSRRKALDSVLTITAEFRNSNSITSLLRGVDLIAIREVIRLLDGLARLEVPDAYAIISDAELAINERFRRGGRGADQYGAKSIIESQVSEIAASLKMNLDEENKFRKAVLDNLTIPIELNSRSVRSVIETWRTRLFSELEGKVLKTESALKQYWVAVSAAVEKVVQLDQMLAIAIVMRKYSLSIPVIGTDGIGFANGRNILLSHDQIEGNESKVVPISYSVGKTISIKLDAQPRNVVMLTGANSGGKTTLLTTVATIHILSLLGLPVPAEDAEVNPVPIYLFRRRTTKRVGSLEQALKTLIPVFADKQAKLILIDEFEALTEPGAAGRIVASIMNHVASGSSLVLLVTHLAAEILPYVKLPIRVDGIEAIGIDLKGGNLLVNRQPKFNHIGSSTPQHIISKLSRINSAKDATGKGKARNSRQIATLYDEILASLSEETKGALQTPLTFPWISEEK